MVRGAIARVDDQRDLYRFELSEDRIARVELDLSTLPEAVEYGLAVYDAGGSLIEGYRTMGVRHKAIQRHLTADVYYLGVFPIAGHGVSDQPYAVRWLSHKRPELVGPPNRSTVYSPSGRAALSWEPVLADGFEVHVHNIYDEKCGSRFNSVFSTRESTMVLTDLPCFGEYWWRVRVLMKDAPPYPSAEQMFALCQNEEMFLEVKSTGTGKLEARCAIAAGEEYYADRDYRVTGLTESLVGLPWIATANNDKAATDERFLTFRLSRPADVLVAYRQGASTIPNWLKAFDKVDAEIQVDDDGVGVLQVYSRFFHAGQITLGANQAPGTEDGGSNYIVLARARR